MSNSGTIETKQLKIGLKSFLTMIAILYAIIIVVGILTYVVPSGTYDFYTEGEHKGEVIADSFHFIESTTRLPVWRWITAPVEAVLWGEGNMLIVQVIAVILVLGGAFNVLDHTGGISALIRTLITRLQHHKYFAVCAINLVMMLFGSLFGLQEELLILFPVFLAFAEAMKWSNTTAISLILITSGAGYTAAIFNPFTIGLASDLAGISLLDGLGYRVIIFVVLYVVTSLFLLMMVKTDERRVKDSEMSTTLKQALCELTEEQRQEENRKTRLVVTLFAVVTLVMILSVTIPPLEELGMSMVFMGAAFIIGTFIIGPLMEKDFKKVLKAFLTGVKNIAPSIVIVMLAFSVKYIAEQGNILHTVFYYAYNYITAQSPYVAVILLYLLVLAIDFFLPGAASKALLLIPLLTLVPIPMISTNTIILAFLFGDGFTNVFFPTCGTLVIGLSLANVSLTTWFKRTWLFQLVMALLSLVFLIIAVAIGI